MKLSEYGFLRLIVMEYFCEQSTPRTISDLAWRLRERYRIDFEDRRVITLKHVVSTLVSEGFLQKTGQTRNTRYIIVETARSQCEEVRKELEKKIPYICEERCGELLKRVEELERKMNELRTLIEKLIDTLSESSYTARLIHSIIH